MICLELSLPLTVKNLIKTNKQTNKQTLQLLKEWEKIRGKRKQKGCHWWESMSRKVSPWLHEVSFKSNDIYSRHIWGNRALVVRNLLVNAGDTGSIPGSGRSPRGRHGNPLYYSCLESPIDRGDCWAIVHRVVKSLTWLKKLST